MTEELNYNLSAEQWEEVKTQFQAWNEIQDRKKELSAENRDVCKRAAAIFGGKASDASKLFKNMKQKWDGETPEASVISLMMDQLEANGN